MTDPTRAPQFATPVYLAVPPVTTYTPLGFQQIDDLSSVETLTVPLGTTFAMIEASAQNVSYRDDGVDPTPTHGMTIYAGPGISYSGPLDALRFIAAAVGAVLKVSYYK